MKRGIGIFILASIMVLCRSFYGYTQDNSSFYLSGTFNKYINYLNNSGRLNLRHPLNQPYTTGMLLSALEKDTLEDDFLKMLLEKDLKRFNPEDTIEHLCFIGGEGNIDAGNEEDEFRQSYSANANGGYIYKNLTAYYSYEANSAFLEDSAYFGTTGKLQNNVFGRTSNSYLKYNNKYITLFYGRMNRNYGLDNLSLIRSYNPYSYDHFSAECSNKLLRYSFSLTRLEDKYAYDIRDSVQAFDWYKRYISFHRLELALGKNFKMALTESILYGGVNQTLVPAYINPMNVFFLSKMSDRKGLEENDANSLMSVELYTRFLKKFSFFGQFLIDDMDFTKELRDEFPDRIGAITKLTATDIIPLSQIYVSYTYISNWTYNSFYTFGNYTFYGKSLGYPKNGFEELKAGFDLFKIKRFIFSLEANVQREREQDLEAAFTGEKTNFPIGIARKAKRLLVDVRFIPLTYLQAFVRTEYVSFNNYLNIKGNSADFFNFCIGISFRPTGLLFHKS